VPHLSHPTLRAFYKLQQFTSEAAAQRYMDSKPVPYVQRGSKKYIVDHHHTLGARHDAHTHSSTVFAIISDSDALARLSA
jgi:hypothetical protein